MMTTHARAWIRLGAALALTVAANAATSAHDMALSRAVARFNSDGTFAIDILVDPQSLLAQLALVRGEVPKPLDGSARLAQARRRLGQLAEGIEVYFDGQRAPLAVEYSTTIPLALSAGLDATALGDAGILQVTGAAPENAQHFSFAYRWTYGAMPLTIERSSAIVPASVFWVGPGERSQAIALRDARPAATFDTAWQYLQLGFTHIVPKGLDHILFVLGLFFLSAGWRALLLQVTTFTIAHTVTLGLTMLGLVSVSPSIVEPLIALSIAYIAIENLTTSTLRRSRLALIFAFGLLHGMGFAGVLTELGVPASGFVVALLSFNAGVECGQMAVLAAATLIVAGWRRREASLLPLVARPASIAIAAGGLYWTVERLTQ
jgi:hypothetical protein